MVYLKLCTHVSLCPWKYKTTTRLASILSWQVDKREENKQERYKGGRKGSVGSSRCWQALRCFSDGQIHTDQESWERVWTTQFIAHSYSYSKLSTISMFTCFLVLLTDLLQCSDVTFTKNTFCGNYLLAGSLYWPIKSFCTKGTSTVFEMGSPPASLFKLSTLYSVE